MASEAIGDPDQRRGRAEHRRRRRVAPAMLGELFVALQLLAQGGAHRVLTGRRFPNSRHRRRHWRGQIDELHRLGGVAADQRAGAANGLELVVRLPSRGPADPRRQGARRPRGGDRPPRPSGAGRSGGVANAGHGPGCGSPRSPVLAPRCSSSATRRSPWRSRSPSGKAPVASCSTLAPRAVHTSVDERGGATATLTSVVPHVDEVADGDMDRSLNLSAWFSGRPRRLPLAAHRLRGGAPPHSRGQHA